MAVNRGSHAVACNGFSQVFSSRQKGGISPKIYLFAPLRWRLSIFGQINIGWIPCLEFSFFMPFWGELSAVAFCYGAWFIGLVLVFGGEGVGELLGYFGVGDSDDVCCGGGEAEKVDVAVPHN